MPDRMSRLPCALQVDFSWLSSRMRKERPVLAFPGISSLRDSPPPQGAPSARSVLIFRKSA